MLPSSHPVKLGFATKH